MNSGSKFTKAARDVKQGLKSEAAEVAVNVQEQVVPDKQSTEEVYRTEDYKKKVSEEDNAKLSQVRSKLDAEMARARQERAQGENQYVQIQEENMRQTSLAGSEESQSKILDNTPAAIKSKRGTGESGRRSRKG